MVAPLSSGLPVGVLRNALGDVHASRIQIIFKCNRIGKTDMHPLQVGLYVTLWCGALHSCWVGVVG